MVGCTIPLLSWWHTVEKVCLCVCNLKSDFEA